MSTTPIDTALLPADIRKAGPKAEQLYSAALDFEQVLLRQVTSELDATTQADGSGDGSGGSDGSGNDGTDASTSSVQSLIPDAFAQSLAASGGVGIARELYNDLKAAPK